MRTNKTFSVKHVLNTRTAKIVVLVTRQKRNMEYPVLVTKQIIELFWVLHACGASVDKVD